MSDLSLEKIIPNLTRTEQLMTECLMLATTQTDA